MSAASVELAIRKQIDALSLTVEEMIAATQPGLWTLADAASDETYENTIKGSTLTAVDDALSIVALGDSKNLSAWLTLHATYGRVTLGLSTSDTFQALLRYYGWRVSLPFAQAIYEPKFIRKLAVGTSALHRDCVGAKGIWDGLEVAAEWAQDFSNADSGTGAIGDNSTTRLHKFGSLDGGTSTNFGWTDAAGNAYTQATVTATCGTALDSTRTVGSPVVVSALTGQTVTATLTCTSANSARTGGVTKTFTIVLTGAAHRGVVGQTYLTGTCGLGSATYPNKLVCLAGGWVAIGDWVVVSEGSGDTLKQEVCRVTGVSGGTLTVSENLKHGYTDSGAVAPLYINACVTAKASGTGDFDVFACPDRDIS